MGPGKTCSPILPNKKIKRKKRPTLCPRMAAVTCWWVRPRRQRALGTGLRPSPPHTQRPSFWALEGERGKGWRRVVRTVPETPPQRYHSGFRQAPSLTHIPPLLKLHTRVLTTKSKCRIRTSGVTWSFLLSCSPAYPSELSPMSPPQGSLPWPPSQ